MPSPTPPESDNSSVSSTDGPESEETKKLRDIETPADVIQAILQDEKFQSSLERRVGDPIKKIRYIPGTTWFEYFFEGVSNPHIESKVSAYCIQSLSRTPEPNPPTSPFFFHDLRLFC
jgi:hypothetical protein